MQMGIGGMSSDTDDQLMIDSRGNTLKAEDAGGYKSYNRLPSHSAKDLVPTDSIVNRGNYSSKRESTNINMNQIEEAENETNSSQSKESKESKESKPDAEAHLKSHTSNSL